MGVRLLTMPAGRPTILTEELLVKARGYLATCVDTYEEFHKTRGDSSNTFERKLNANIPTIEGFALHIGVGRNTIYTWEDEASKDETKNEMNIEFRDILEEIRLEQAKRLINKGASGEYSAPISKVMLSKHGYREAVEQTGLNGTPLQIQVVNYADTVQVPPKKVSD